MTGGAACCRDCGRALQTGDGAVCAACRQYRHTHGLGGVGVPLPGWNRLWQMPHASPWPSAATFRLCRDCLRPVPARHLCCHACTIWRHRRGVRVDDDRFACAPPRVVGHRTAARCAYCARPRWASADRGRCHDCHQRRPLWARGLCLRCYSYRRGHAGAARPCTLPDRPPRIPRDGPCRVCGLAPIAQVGRCPACAQYWRRHGTERPLALPPFCCRQCQRRGPHAGHGLCRRCYQTTDAYVTARRARDARRRGRRGRRAA
jgi:hypothetical protein